jgi:hypothetical protein
MILAHFVAWMRGLRTPMGSWTFDDWRGCWIVKWGGDVNGLLADAKARFPGLTVFTCERVSKNIYRVWVSNKPVATLTAFDS